MQPATQSRLESLCTAAQVQLIMQSQPEPPHSGVLYAIQEWLYEQLTDEERATIEIWELEDIAKVGLALRNDMQRTAKSYNVIKYGEEQGSLLDAEQQRLIDELFGS